MVTSSDYDVVLARFERHLADAGYVRTISGHYVDVAERFLRYLRARDISDFGHPRARGEASARAAARVSSAARTPAAVHEALANVALHWHHSTVEADPRGVAA